MRLLDTHTGQFVERDPEDKETVYAILSHTWDKKGEQTYEELMKIQQRHPAPVQTLQKKNLGQPYSSTSSSRKWNRDVTHRTSSFSRPTSSSASWISRSPKFLRHLFQSEAESSLRDVVQRYGLMIPSPPAASIWDDPELSPKIRDACRIAKKNGYHYIWIDSCCIDKSSSSELSEAINSMYKWYGLAAVCYAYLADVPPGKDHRAQPSAFRRSRWFRRGWTLQELIAPVSVEFLSKNWAPIGSKHTLFDLVESVTNINYKALLNVEPLDVFSVAQRLSWAANRETTRVEDHAYSLLGIFNINMPTLYGEGNQAFRRLQEQVMQRTPDQSLFAWGNLYLSSVRPKLDFADTSKGLRAQVRKHHHSVDAAHLLAMSPRLFRGCEHISASRHNTFQLPSHLSRHEIEYTSTPYGIRTQFWMIHLTQDLHSLHIPLHSEDVQLKFLDLLVDSEWYLVILRCEHREKPRHLLGRVCYTSPSETNVPFIHAGFIRVQSQGGSLRTPPDLLLLSPQTIELLHPHTELKTVYIPHPDRAPLSPSLKLRREPYTTIKLVLLRETCEALRSRGYSADLRHPDLDYLTTHWLTLFKDEHTITVEFQHTLRDRGYEFTIEAEVKMPGFHVQLESALDCVQADRHTVSWSDKLSPWYAELGHESVKFSAVGAGTLTVDLALDFMGRGYYILRVDVLSDVPPASSANEPGIDQGEEGERTEEGRPSGAINTEDVWSRGSRGGGRTEDVTECGGSRCSGSER